MPLCLRRALIRGLFPQNLAGFLVQRKHLPLVRAAIRNRVRVPIEAGAERLLGIARDSRGDVDPIAPHNRRGDGEAGNLGFPDDVRSLVCIPLHGWVSAIADSGRRRTAKLRPIAVGARAGHDQNTGHRHEPVPHFATPFLNVNVLPPCFNVKLSVPANSTWISARPNANRVGLKAFMAISV